MASSNSLRESDLRFWWVDIETNVVILHNQSLKLAHGKDKMLVQAYCRTHALRVAKRCYTWRDVRTFYRGGI